MIKANYLERVILSHQNSGEVTNIFSMSFESLSKIESSVVKLGIQNSKGRKLKSLKTKIKKKITGTCIQHKCCILSLYFIFFVLPNFF